MVGRIWWVILNTPCTLAGAAGIYIYIYIYIEDAYGDGPPPPTFEFPTVVAALKHSWSFCSFWCFCISWISALFE